MSEARIVIGQSTLSIPPDRHSRHATLYSHLYFHLYFHLSSPP